MSEQLQIVHLDIEKVLPNSWNPNAQDDATFNLLVEQIKEVGFIEPIQVAPLSDGTYRILGGEHRWKASQVLGYKTVPSIVLVDEKFADEDLQKFMTVRLNVIRGRIDSSKFMKLFEGLAGKYQKEALGRLMGFADQNAFAALTGDLKKAVKSTVELPEGVKKKFDKAIEEVKSVDGLSKIISDIFAKHGNTSDRHYMFFSFAGKKHIMVMTDAAMWKEVRAIADFCEEKGVSMRDVYKALLSRWRSAVDSDPATESPEPAEDD